MSSKLSCLRYQWYPGHLSSMEQGWEGTTLPLNYLPRGTEACQEAWTTSRPQKLRESLERPESQLLALTPPPPPLFLLEQVSCP